MRIGNAQHIASQIAYKQLSDSVILYITWPALHGAQTSEMPAPDHECMHTYTHRFSCVPQAHNTSYIVNNSNMNGKSYNLILLDLPSLNHRRIRGDLIFLCNLINGYFNLDVSTF